MSVDAQCVPKLRFYVGSAAVCVCVKGDGGREFETWKREWISSDIGN